MKILNLKFKNINSLSSENEIDFTNPVFTNDGLFAITGKTGAGKSSILDAISLAFYGKTPRVDITGNENAVMTRGEKDCYAEVIFEVAGKKWKSSWKQELNRNGNLKPINRVIADCDDNIIADQVRSCDTEIVKIIGLTFEQFTKVIMLAQGSFAAFLQADKNDKGQLLEQITGTEIYAAISKIAFERNRTEKEKLDKISLELEAIKILSKEEIANLINDNIVFEKDKIQIDVELQNIEAAIKWLSDLANLQNQIKEAKEKLPELEAKTKTSIETFEKSEAALKTTKDEQKKQEPVFKQVRELDTKISEKEKLLKPILKVIFELEKINIGLSKTLENQNLELEKSEKTQAEKQDWATKNLKYEELVSNYSVIEKENQLLEVSLTEIKKLNTEIADLQNEVELKQYAFTSAKEVFTEKSNILTAKTVELETKKSELVEILGGKELNSLRSEKENIKSYGTQLKSLIEVENAIFVNQKEIKNLDEKLKQFEKSNKEFSERIGGDNITITNLESQINLLDENIKLTKTIQSLDEHRVNLKDGEVCFLCGALDHPFAHGNVPQIGEKDIELGALKKQLHDTTKLVQQNEKDLAALVSDNENALRNKSKEEKTLNDNSEKQKKILFEILSIKSTFYVPIGENRIERLNQFLDKTYEEFKQINTSIIRAEKYENQINNLRDKEILALRTEREAVGNSKSNAEIAHKLAVQQFEEKQKSTASIQEKYKSDSISFFNKLKNYEVVNIEDLKRCLDTWNINRKQSDDLKIQITTLKSNIALNKKDLENQENSFNDKLNEKQDIEIDKQNLADKRTEIFDSKSVEDEEIRMNKLVENAESAKTNAEKVKNDINTEFEKNISIVSEKDKELLEMQEHKITEKLEESLKLELIEKKYRLAEFSEKIGANKQTLKFNTENLKISGSKLKEKEQQQVFCNKWGNLNELIGSGDGKKYRNFAQALTFEHLIGLSNLQLKKMSDRYILKRTGEPSNPFELSVVDNFQNSEERTAQNLSGGEKFIVSLSLALGLANMASKNMRIDTLFIDEGFGTLDSDYLDVALNALSNLQSEGKIIGVISHLTELKERIATHIEVIPCGNGHSKIQISN